jgi:hypothetical protein
VPKCDGDNGVRGCRPSHDCRDKHKDKEKHDHGGRDCDDDHNGNGHHGFDDHGANASNRSVTIQARSVVATMPATGGNRVMGVAIFFGGCVAAVAALTTLARRRLADR